MNMTKEPTGLIVWPGCEPVETPRSEAIATLRAAAFVSEPVRVKHGGRWVESRDIPRPSGLTDLEVIKVQEILMHRIHFKLERFLPAGTTINVVGPERAAWDEGYMIEVSDGFMIGATVELDRGYRGAIRWHVYDPEGDPIVEGVDEALAMSLLVGSVAAYIVKINWNKEDAP